MPLRKKYKVLVVDDEEGILELLKYNLEKEGYEVRMATHGVQALEIAQGFLPHLVLLDIMMPGMDGVETCRQLRAMAGLQSAYIVFLTARVEEYSEVAAFDVGADDYITKPIKPRALMSRIQALFRRETIKEEQSKAGKVTIGPLTIDRDTHVVQVGNKEMYLPKKEFDLLFFLASHPNKVFKREFLLEKIWGSDVYVVERTVDVHIRKVREKIGEDFIQTMKGVGYKFSYQ